MRAVEALRFCRAMDCSEISSAMAATVEADDGLLIAGRVLSICFLRARDVAALG